MLSTAFTLGLLTTVGFYLVYSKLPTKAKKFITKYPLLSDVFALIGTYALFGGTVTALIAGAMVSIVVSMLLHVANHPDDFMWLTDSIQAVKDALAKIQEWMTQLNQQYRAAKGEPEILEAHVAA